MAHTELAAIAALVTEVERIVLESGDPTGFDAHAWVLAFIDAPSRALGGVTPRTLLATDLESVLNLLRRVQASSYS